MVGKSQTNRRGLLASAGATLGTMLLVASVSPAAFAQTFERGPARSPHGPLSIPCGSCHTSTSWTPLRSIPEFNHSRETRYPLRGLHESVQCRLCHTKMVFANVGTKCADCHADIHRRQFGARCEECHTVKGWRGAVQTVSRHQNRFPLLGAHATLECEACHRGAGSAQFTGLSTGCAACHLKDYQQARPLDHQVAGLPLACEQCHGMDNWRSKNFDHARFTRFPLDGAHAGVECAACHTGGRFTGTPIDCFSCHAKEFSATRSPDHVKAGFPKECAICHTGVSWKGARFDHSALTRFPLTGAHIQAECASCHQGGRFAGTPTDCYGCHIGNYEAVKNPDHLKSGFSTRCADCHTTERWEGAKFDHNRSRFPLTGAHVQVSCAQCHVSGRFTGTITQCSGCHLGDYNRTTNPNHATAGFPQDCTSCHTTAQWKGAVFDHNKATKFPLTGAHVQVACGQCHVNNKYAGTLSQCSACHLADYRKTTDPNHAAAGFPEDCAVCHTTAQWKGALFDHKKTKFALTGAHLRAQCAQCHVNNTYAGTPSQCAICHLADYNKTTDPNHAAAGFPQDCTLCHTTAQWKGARFDHNKSTKFPLTGAHIQVACGQCHVNNKYAGTSSQCSACHLADYNKTTNPNHSAAGFPQDCAVCHTTAQWGGAKFDHNTATRFPLTGAHVQVACSQCHANNKFAGTPTQCSACHLTDYNKTTNPNHTAAGFPQDCTLCHTTSQWKGAVFDHSRTKFALTGAHVRVECGQCHKNNMYSGTPAQCDACHLADYNKTTNPNHAAAGFPRDCSVCHSTSQWSGAKFDHSQTKFPLTGRHTSVQCASCHVGGKYAGLSTACVSCHLANYNSTTNPNHQSAGFPQQCEVCHSTSGWTPASFNHSTTKFPLTGKHTTVPCASCHIGGRYAGTPTDCYSCHQQAYDTTTNPNHAAAGFPRNCSTCHTTITWSGATFNHTFPIYTGKHAGKWTTCNDCHTNPSNYQAFSCTTCHEHAQITMDAKHQGVRNYVYNSANCYACHPRGTAD